MPTEVWITFFKWTGDDDVSFESVHATRSGATMHVVSKIKEQLNLIPQIDEEENRSTVEIDCSGINHSYSNHWTPIAWIERHAVKP